MIYVIMHRGVSHGQRAKARPVSMAVAFVTGSVTVGAVTGALLGFVGSSLAASDRIAIGAAFALAGLTVGTSEALNWRAVPVLQVDRETNQQWLNRSPALGALATGAVIGAGFATRLGFWLWYVIPVGCFVAGHPGVGAAVYAGYAGTRAFIPAILSLSAVHKCRDDAGDVNAYAMQEKMMNLTRHLPIRALTGTVLVAISAMYLAS